MRRALLVLTFASLCAAAYAAAWGHYANVRFGYSVDVPPGFSSIEEADNGDGGMSHSQDKLSQFAVWGAYGEGGLAQTFADRLKAAEADGWKITYKRETKNWASWSGWQQSRIFYARAITLCPDSAAFFLIEYPRARKASFDPLVGRLVKSLKKIGSC